MHIHTPTYVRSSLHLSYGYRAITYVRIVNHGWAFVRMQGSPASCDPRLYASAGSGKGKCLRMNEGLRWLDYIYAGCT